MLIKAFKILLTRDLNRLKKEITLYGDEKKQWYIEENISNSGDDLCLHLIGNVNTYIGAQFGESGYIRNREAEFSLTGISREGLIEKIEETKTVIIKTLDNITEDQLQAECPELVFLEKISTEYLLVHLA